LFANTVGIDFELIFVDNGSKDGTLKYLKNLQLTNNNLQIITNDTNLGFAKANNQGIKVSSGEYILLLNNDVILTPKWLEKMLRCIESDESIGVVGPLTNHAVGQQVVNYPFSKKDVDINKFAVLMEMKYGGVYEQTHRIIGFCMLIKREVIEKVGLLDERFGPGGFEDYDYCLRVNQHGYKIMIAKDVFVYHLGGRGYSKNDLDYNSLRKQNFEIFVDKWCKKALEILEHMPSGII
jgi:GT2 family glycosyltransferase